MVGVIRLPIQGQENPFANEEIIDFRLLNQGALIRLAGGRNLIDEFGKNSGFWRYAIVINKCLL